MMQKELLDTNITEWGAHSGRGNTKEGLDSLASPAKLGYDLLIGQIGQSLIQRY